MGSLTKTWNHDCTDCCYLVTTMIEGGLVDFYHCVVRGFPRGGSIIGRMGNDPPDYWSMPVPVIEGFEGEGSPILQEAQRLAAQLP